MLNRLHQKKNFNFNFKSFPIYKADLNMGHNGEDWRNLYNWNQVYLILIDLSCHCLRDLELQELQGKCQEFCPKEKIHIFLWLHLCWCHWYDVPSFGGVGSSHFCLFSKWGWTEWTYSVSRNHDTVIQDNPQTLLWAVSFRNYSIFFLYHCAERSGQLVYLWMKR